MLGPITSGENISPVSGNRYPGPITSNAQDTAPLDPLTVPNVLRVMYYSSPYPLKRDLSVAGNGDEVVFVNDQLGGGRVDKPANIDDATERPIMHADGLSFSTNGADLCRLIINDNTAITNGLSEFTAYLWGTQVDNNELWCPLGSADGGSGTMIGVIGNNLTVVDDSFNSNTAGTVAGGKVLIRFNVNSSGVFSMNATGIGSATSGSGFGDFTFDAVGMGNFGAPNADAGNRYMGGILIGRSIAEGIAEDLGLRAGINLGTYTGKSGYAL